MSMFYNNMGISYQDIQPFDLEFKNQITAKQGILDPQIIKIICADWENNKTQIVLGIRQSVMQKCLILNQQTISQAVFNYIHMMVQRCTSGNYMNAMPMGVMGQNPYVNGYRPAMGQAMQYQAMPSGIMNPMQPSTMVYDTPTAPVPTPAVPQQQPQDEKQNSVLQVCKVEEPEFKVPTNDDPDDLFGSEQHDTVIGNIKVSAMIDGYGSRFKYIDIKLHDCCKSAEEAIDRARLMYDPIEMTNYHIDIRYDKVVKIDVPYDKFIEVVGRLRQAIGRASKAKKQLKYLEGVVKVLNAECRGVADAIEGFLMKEFMRVARYGCIDSDTTDTEFGVRDMISLIELADKDTTVPLAQGWQQIKGFSERLVDIVNETIKNIIMNCRILDPNNISEIGKILRTYAGLMATADGELVDVVDDLNDKREEFCKASMEDKRNLFGAAGAVVADTTVLIIPDQQLILTTFAPERSLGNRAGAPVALMETNFIGGVDKNGVANSSTSTFEYMMTDMSLTDGKFAKVVVNFTESLSGCYNCVRTTDHWYRLTPAPLND